MPLFFLFFYFRKKNVGKHIFSYDKPTEILKKGIVYQSAKFWRARARASASERERAARSLARLKIKEEQLALARSQKNLNPFSSLARARSRTFFKASARELVQLPSQFRKLAS